MLVLSHPGQLIRHPGLISLPVETNTVGTEREAADDSSVTCVALHGSARIKVTLADDDPDLLAQEIAANLGVPEEEQHLLQEFFRLERKMDACHLRFGKTSI